jgi:hypothetical protein
MLVEKVKHTKEPWWVDVKPDLSEGKTAVYSQANGELVAVAVGSCVSFRETEACAKRIASCVNACAGLSNEVLDAGFISYIVNWFIEHEYLTARLRVRRIPDKEARFMGKKIFEEDV